MGHRVENLLMSSAPKTLKDALAGGLVGVLLLPEVTAFVQKWQLTSQEDALLRRASHKDTDDSFLSDSENCHQRCKCIALKFESFAAGFALCHEGPFVFKTREPGHGTKRVPLLGINVLFFLFLPNRAST